MIHFGDLLISNSKGFTIYYVYLYTTNHVKLGQHLLTYILIKHFFIHILSVLISIVHVVTLLMTHILEFTF